MSDPHNWSPTERELAAFDNRNVCDGCGRPVEDGGAPAPVGMGREVEAIALLREVADPDEQDMPASLGSVLLMRGRPLHDRILAFLAAAPEHQATPAGPEKSPAGARASAPPADSDGDGCQACVDGVDHISCEPYFVPANAPATPPPVQPDARTDADCKHCDGLDGAHTVRNCPGASAVQADEPVDMPPAGPDDFGGTDYPDPAAVQSDMGERAEVCKCEPGDCSVRDGRAIDRRCREVAAANPDVGDRCEHGLSPSGCPEHFEAIGEVIERNPIPLGGGEEHRETLHEFAPGNPERCTACGEGSGGRLHPQARTVNPDIGERRRPGLGCGASCERCDKKCRCTEGEHSRCLCEDHLGCPHIEPPVAPPRRPPEELAKELAHELAAFPAKMTAPEFELWAGRRIALLISRIIRGEM